MRLAGKPDAVGHDLVELKAEHGGTAAQSVQEFGIQKRLAQRPDDPLLLYMQADILLEQGAEPGSADFETAVHSAKI